MADQAQLHILVIGGGVAGTALAQLLQTNSNVRCSVFDRDATIKGRYQKWSVSLSTCLPVLAPKLVRRLGPFTKASSVRDAGLTDTAGIVDCKTGEKRVKWGRETPGPGYFILANRQRMREYFAQGVEVSWGKRFTHYEEDAKGVTAFFDDGSQVRGDLLVGVDGSNSRVRNQLLEGVADTATQARPYAVLAASMSVSAAQHESLSRDMESFCFTQSNGSILHMGLLHPLTPASDYDYSKDKGPASYYFHLYIPDAEAATLSTDYKTPDGKLFWTQTASAGEMRARALEHTKDWKGPVREIVELAKDEDMLVPPYLLRDWCPPADLVLPRGRVTLMGDAAHQMIPFRGTGANTAILDAVELAELIDGVTLGKELAVKPGMDVLQPALDEYWKRILPRARETVLTSRHALEKDPNGDTTVQMISKAMSGGGPPPGMGGPGGPGGPPGGFDGSEADARRGLMWRG